MTGPKSPHQFYYLVYRSEVLRILSKYFFTWFWVTHNEHIVMSGLKIHNVILQGRWIWSELSGNWNSIQREGALQSPLTISTNTILAGHNWNKIIQRTPEKEGTARQPRLSSNRYENLVSPWARSKVSFLFRVESWPLPTDWTPNLRVSFFRTILKRIFDSSLKQIQLRISRSKGTQNPENGLQAWQPRKCVPHGCVKTTKCP